MQKNKITIEIINNIYPQEDYNSVEEVIDYLEEAMSDYGIYPDDIKLIDVKDTEDDDDTPIKEVKIRLYFTVSNKNTEKLENDLMDDIERAWDKRGCTFADMYVVEEDDL